MKRRLTSTLAVLVSSLAAGVAAADCSVAPDLLTEVRLSVDVGEQAVVTLADLQWFVGDWQGSVFGMSVQHLVLEPVSGQMPGLVRLYNDDGVQLYELSSFLLDRGELVYRNRLFDRDLKTSLGPTGEMMTRPALAVEDDVVFFDGITFARNGENCAVVSFILPNQEGRGQKNSVFFEKR